jgi:hypothetical protein
MGPRVHDIVLAMAEIYEKGAEGWVEGLVQEKGPTRVLGSTTMAGECSATSAVKGKNSEGHK